MTGDTESVIQRAAGKYHVIIVSPTSFLAYLQTVLQGLRAMQIQEQTKEEKKLFGGIVANTDQRKYKGKWIYFDKPSKDFKKDFFDTWKNFNL